MKIILYALLIAIFGLPNIALAEDGHVAIFKNVSGNIKVIRNKAELATTPGMQLMQSDVVVSGPDASGGIAFRDGTLLTVGASSEIEISQYVFQPKEAKYGFSLYLKKGTAIYSSGKIGKLSPESVNLNTPRAVIGVRGTRFIVTAGQEAK